MTELGKKNEIFGADLLIALTFERTPDGRPVSMPSIPNDHKVVCGYDQGLGERMIVCESLEEMQTLYDAYARGGALRIHWYHAPDPGFVFVG
jgi:hypothetical protein